MATNEHAQGSYAAINGLNLYYEDHGSGQPLVLLPGGFMTVEAMGAIVPQLAATRRVIGVELQGHGRLRFTLLTPRPTCPTSPRPTRARRDACVTRARACVTRR